MPVASYFFLFDVTHLHSLDDLSVFIPCMFGFRNCMSLDLGIGWIFHKTSIYKTNYNWNLRALVERKREMHEICPGDTLPVARDGDKNNRRDEEWDLQNHLPNRWIHYVKFSRIHQTEFDGWDITSIKVHRK